jgi:hypothetical protein
MGLGATLTLDLWSLFLKRVFKITPSNFCLVGRWLRYMPEGIFKHSNIAAVPGKSGECMLGWVAHYLIGVTFAMLFVVFVGADWLKHPTLIPAITFGVFTVVAPFFIMQPAFGFGIAAAKASNSTSARVRSLINHFAFGFGLYIFGMLLR